MKSAAKSRQDSLVRQVPLPHQIAKLIRERVANGDLHPGERIVEQDLAKEYGVARGVVREALVKLDEQGVVQRRPHQGTFVTRLSVGQFVKVLQIRAALEILGYELIVKRKDFLDFKPAEQVLCEMRDAAKPRNFLAFAELDMRFHVALLRLSDNEYLVEEIRNFFAYTVVGIRFAVQEDDTPLLNQNDWDSRTINSKHIAVHEKILLALKARALDEARQAFHEHISSSYSAGLTGILGAHPGPS